jgi:hypothetical protein
MQTGPHEAGSARPPRKALPRCRDIDACTFEFRGPHSTSATGKLAPHAGRQRPTNLSLHGSTTPPPSPGPAARLAPIPRPTNPPPPGASAARRRREGARRPADGAALPGGGVQGAARRDGGGGGSDRGGRGGARIGGEQGCAARPACVGLQPKGESFVLAEIMLVFRSTSWERPAWGCLWRLSVAARKCGRRRRKARPVE